MKKIKVDKGNKEAIISREDRELLLSVEELLPNVVVNEVRDAEGCKGYYIIKDSAAYIQRAHFIPNYEELRRMSIDGLRELCREAQRTMEKVDNILTPVFNAPQAISEKDVEYLASIPQLDSQLVHEMAEIAPVKYDLMKELRFISLIEGIYKIMQHYCETISQFLEEVELDPSILVGNKKRSFWSVFGFAF